MKEIRKREIHIDFIKIIAILMVLFNHTKTNGFVLFTVKQDSPFFMFYLFNGIFIKSAVPLFFMASGSLLLGKTETIKQVFIQRFLKYLFVFFLASAGQYLYVNLIYNPKPISFSNFFTTIYTDRIIGTYWYLYAYLSYLLMLPMLRKMATSMHEKEYRWMFLLYGFMQLLSIIEFLIWKGEKKHYSYFSLFITTKYIIYPFIGYYIDHVLDKKHFSKKILLIMSLISIGSILICCYMTIYKCTYIGEWKESSCQTFFETLIFIPAGTLYFAIKLLFLKHRPKEKICKVISLLGGLTFGVYLIENICRVETKGVLTTLEPYITSLPACWAWIVSAFLLGSAVTFIVKLIPGVKKFI